MQDGKTYLDSQLFEGMRQLIDDDVLSALLAEFVRMLETTRAELDQIPHESVEAIRFLAVKLRGSASEYGAIRLADLARTMEQALRTSSHNAVDWRLLLRAEISEAIRACRQEIERLDANPAAQPGLRLVSRR
jgi:HPt (histidine-containing phosphotransfer) domain-containing protein